MIDWHYNATKEANARKPLLFEDLIDSKAYHPSSLIDLNTIQSTQEEKNALLKSEEKKNESI